MAAKAKKQEAQTKTAIHGLKGFDPDWKCCGGFQYEVGKTYEAKGDAVVCHNGFHACDGSPFDVWGYFGPVGDDGRFNRFAETISSGKISRKPGDSDSKFAATKITIEAEVKFPEFLRRGISWLIENTKGKDASGNGARIGSSGDGARIGSSGNGARIGSSGYYAQIGSSGYYAQIGSSGNDAQIGSSGDYARIGSSGNDARIGSSGDYARISSSGNDARIGSSGNDARIGSSGDYARIGSSGNDARIGSSGYDAQIVAEGTDAVIACAGSAKVTAGEGGAICIPYYDGKRTRFAVGYVGEDGIEAGVAYVARRDGKLVRA